MRIVQIIDSLEIGGAERMAVNYANALSDHIEFSGLVATRKEGLMQQYISKKVSYLFLDKKFSFDLKSVFRLKNYLKKNKVEIIHAHSSSFFIAVLVKIIMPEIKIVWHDHFGSRIEQSKKENRVLIFCSLFFDAIFSVNMQLKNWSLEYMYCKNVCFVPNFVLSKSNAEKKTYLKGIASRRIVFLANLKNPKNHIVLLKAFLSLKLSEKGWTLHLIGKDYFDFYSQNLKDFIKVNKLDDCVHLYGLRTDVNFILSQASIGVLSSTFEGFPVTLIEYGKSQLAVLSTNVGFCSDIITHHENGLLFDPLDEVDLALKLTELTNNEALRIKLANNLKTSIERDYQEEQTIEKIILEYIKIK